MSKKAVLSLRVSATADEKVSMRDYETCARGVQIEGTLELQLEIGENGSLLSKSLEKPLNALIQALQMTAEAAVYSSVSRAYESQQGRNRIYRDAAMDRAKRAQRILEMGDPEPTEIATMDPSGKQGLTPDSFVALKQAA